MAIKEAEYIQIMSKWLSAFIITLMACLLLQHQSASAHVFIRDTTGTVGTVLHVVPDDDPIAGQEANLFFDIQTGGNAISSAKLVVTDTASSESVEVPVETNTSAVTATYTFPSQGAYRLELSFVSNRTYTISYTLRVSRGTIGRAVEQPSHTWVQAALVFSLSSAAALIIVALNHRKDIARLSKMKV